MPKFSVEELQTTLKVLGAQTYGWDTYVKIKELFAVAINREGKIADAKKELARLHDELVLIDDKFLKQKAVVAELEAE